jgi:predicted transcriptional regulator
MAQSAGRIRTVPVRKREFFTCNFNCKVFGLGTFTRRYQSDANLNRSGANFILRHHAGTSGVLPFIFVEAAIQSSGFAYSVCYCAASLPLGHRCGYTAGMKTAVSIPEDVFKGAERLARETKRSRSRLFSDALKEYLARHTPDSVTETMNKACAELGAAKDEFVSSAARRVLERSEW